MAHIYVYSPSGSILDKNIFKRAVKRLEKLGHEVEIDENALLRHQRFAGDDKLRLAAISRAASSGADCALITRGGYGLTRLLPELPYELIFKAIERGTKFVGFSDFTAFQLALLAKNREAITWAGPALCEGFGQIEGVDDIMLACFDDALCGIGEGGGWILPKSDLNYLSDFNNDNAIAEDCILWGGNLSMIISLLNTPFFPQITNGILFIEEVNEHPYKIERMLMQLFYAGILQKQKAILIGQCTNYKKSGHDAGYNLNTAINFIRDKLKADNINIPILTGLPFGHVPTKILLPVGAKVDLYLNDRDALILWAHEHNHEHHHEHGENCSCGAK